MVGRSVWKKQAVTFPGVSSAVSYDGVGGTRVSILLCLSFYVSLIYTLMCMIYFTKVLRARSVPISGLRITVDIHHPQVTYLFFNLLGMPTLIHAGR